MAWYNEFDMKAAAWLQSLADGLTPDQLPLAHGFPERVGLIRGFGNAIVPAVAAKFITAFLGAIEDQGGRLT